MKPRTLLLLALALVGSVPQHAIAASITNGELSQILANEQLATNAMASFAQTESVLGSIPANTTLSLQTQSVSSIAQLGQIELLLLTAYQETRFNSIVPIQESLVTQFQELMEQNKALSSLLSAKAINTQVVQSTLVQILSMEHAIASTLLQKQVGMAGTFPADIVVQLQQQYNHWNTIIVSTQARITEALR